MTNDQLIMILFYASLPHITDVWATRSSNTIHPGVKPENYIALARAARKYGRYPINVNHKLEAGK